MGSQTLLTLTARRAEIAQCLRLLESRHVQGRGCHSVTSAVGQLRLEADRLDRRIDLELQKSDPLEPPLTANISASSRALRH